MRKQHGGHAYNYQILTAILYFIKNDFDEFSIEGEEYEDSLFYKDRRLLTLGESKNILSKKQWTEIALFYRGDNKGPLLQLFDCYLFHEEVNEIVIFSSILIKKELKSGLGIRIPNEKIPEIIGNLISKFKYDEDSLNSETLSVFLGKVRIQKTSLEGLEETICFRGFHVK